MTLSSPRSKEWSSRAISYHLPRYLLISKSFGEKKVVVISGDYSFNSIALVFALSKHRCVFIPIISNNCDFGPSEILDNGKYGGLCDINNSNQMAELIHLGLNAKINPIPQNIVTSNYSLDVIGNKYEELLVRR